MVAEALTIHEMDEITYGVMSQNNVLRALTNGFEGINILEAQWKSSVILRWEKTKLKEMATTIHSEGFLSFVKKRWNIKDHEEIAFNFFERNEDDIQWLMYINTSYPHIYSAYMPTLTELILLFQENNWEITEPQDKGYFSNITNNLYRQYTYLNSDKSTITNDFHLRDTQFLSNFDYVPCNLLYNWIAYTCVETAYQAAKFDENSIQEMKLNEEFAQKYNNITTINDLILYISSLSASEAKKFADTRKMYIKKNREDEKIATMYALVKTKFEQNSELKTALIKTWAAFLVEWNSWWDEFWWVHDKKRSGNNYLGKILMTIREELQQSS